MARRWIDSVSDALRRVAARHGTDIIRRSQIIGEELTTIVSETASRGRTPGHTLSRTLQDLRDKRFLRFGEPGVYRLIDTSTPDRKSTVPEDVKVAPTLGRALVPGEAYSWESLGDRFGFGPNYLGAAGGMISRPQHNALLLITHPRSAKASAYGASWH